MIRIEQAKDGANIWYIYKKQRWFGWKLVAVRAGLDRLSATLGNILSEERNDD